MVKTPPNRRGNLNQTKRGGKIGSFNDEAKWFLHYSILQQVMLLANKQGQLHRPMSSLLIKYFTITERVVPISAIGFKSMPPNTGR